MPRRPRLPKRKRSHRLGWGNAILAWEITRVTRKIGVLSVGRFAFGLSLLAVLWILWRAEFRSAQTNFGDIQEFQRQQAKLAGRFAEVFFQVQVLVVLVICPVFVIGSIFEERVSRTGEVLFTTDLTRREIFYGKLLGRIFQAVWVVAAGIPVLALTLLFGGVEATQIAVGYLVTLICIVSSTAVCAAVAADTETFSGALLRTYCRLILINCLLMPASPFVVLAIRSYCAWFFFLLAQFLTVRYSLRHGLKRLRLAMLRERRHITDDLRRNLRERPPIDDDAVRWRDRHVVGVNILSGIWSFGLVMGVVLTIFVPIHPFVQPNMDGPDGGSVSRVGLGTGLMVAVGCIIAGLSAATSIARERQRRILSDLFMIPEPRIRMLKSKLIESIRPLWWLPMIVAHGPVLELLDGGSVWAIPLVPIAATILLLFSTTLGLWLSVRCRTARQAVSAWLVVMAVPSIGTWQIAEAFRRPVITDHGVEMQVYPDWARCICIPLTWDGLVQRTGVKSSTPPSTPSASVVNAGSAEASARYDFEMSLIGLGSWAVLWLFLWWRTVRRFENEERY